MALRLQYNKIQLQALQKALRVREYALPTLQAKEAALRLEAKRARQEAVEIEARLEAAETQLDTCAPLWNELPEDLLRVEDIELGFRRIAGVRAPMVKNVRFNITRFSLFLQPSWLPAGLELLMAAVRLQIEADAARRRIAMLERARRKTTQKVNLYEKVQIPEYRESIRKVKRFLEDEQNLATAAMKMLKARIEAAEAAS